MSHWSDIFTWRQLHYKHLIKPMKTLHRFVLHSKIPCSHIQVSNSHSIHYLILLLFFLLPGQQGHGNSSPLCQCHHHLYPVCLDLLSKIHSIPSVPVLDWIQKIRQQVGLAQPERWTHVSSNDHHNENCLITSPCKVTTSFLRPTSLVIALSSAPPKFSDIKKYLLGTRLSTQKLVQVSFPYLISFLSQVMMVGVNKAMASLLTPICQLRLKCPQKDTIGKHSSLETSGASFISVCPS